MISLTPVPSFTPAQYKATANFGGYETMFYFMSHTRHFYTLEDGDTPLAILGLVPASMLSNRALIWFGPMKGVEFTRRMIREGKALAEVFFSRIPYSVYAELDPAKPDTIHFAKFFGMKYYDSACGVHLYERAK